MSLDQSYRLTSQKKNFFFLPKDSQVECGTLEWAIPILTRAVNVFNKIMLLKGTVTQIIPKFHVLAAAPTVFWNQMYVLPARLAVHGLCVCAAYFDHMSHSWFNTLIIQNP